MSPRPESWESVARALGERMRYQANRCPAGYTTFDGGNIDTVEDQSAVHRVPDDYADECPFCADTVAYRRYLARASGRPYARSSQKGES